MTASAPSTSSTRAPARWSLIVVLVSILNGAVGGYAAYTLFYFVQWPVDADAGLPSSGGGWLWAALPRACFAGAVGLAVVIVLSSVNSLIARVRPELARYTGALRIAVVLAMAFGIAYGAAEFVIRKPIL